MINIKKTIFLNWKKTNDMIPAIIQNYQSGEILMHGYMNQESLQITIETKLVTFFSRNKKKVWTKGETSGNFLKVINIFSDCDLDTLLLIVDPIGNTCHKDFSSCFNYKNDKLLEFNFLSNLENYLIKRKKLDPKLSYTSKLCKNGIKRIAQKVAEEGIEVALSSVTDNNKHELIDETSDLIYHVLVLLSQNNIKFIDIIKNLKNRHNSLKNK